MTKRILWAAASAAVVVWWEILLWALLGYVVFWLWFFFYSRAHCPNCGRSLELGANTPVNIYRDSCSCGWRRT
jgi:hypothetical protein